MNPGIRISLEGRPDTVQLMADLIDCALPDTITWKEIPVFFSDGIIKIDGIGAPMIVIEKV